MGRLFWKIFLSFWLTLLLVIVGSNAVTALYFETTDESERIKKRQQFLHQQIETLVNTLAQGGMAAMNKAFHHRRLPPPLFELSILNANQQIVLHRQRQHKPLPHHRPLATITRSVTAVNGQQYQIIAKVPKARHHSPFRLFLRPFQRSPSLILPWLSMAIVLSIMVCFWLAWYLTQPIRQLQQASQRLAAGDFSTRVAPQMGNRRDEMTDLGNDFDEMAARLHTLLLAQKQLLSDISHELRSPLARLQVAIALTRKKTDDSVSNELDRIERDVVRLDDLIAQILTLSRLETDNKNSSKYHKDDYVDMALLLEDIVEDAEFEAQSKQRHVTLSTQQTWTVKANAELLRRALENIIRNAIRYTAKQSHVSVTLTPSEDQTNTLCIHICDQGAGVPEEQLERLFEPFVRVSDSRNRHSGGYGLGLAIAERAVHLHHGTIDAFNHPQGGLCVVVHLPIID